LNNCKNEQLYLFIHEVIDGMCGISDAPMMDKYVPQVWPDEQQFRKACLLCQEILPNAIDVRSKHESILKLPEESQKVIYQCMEVRRAQLKNAIVNEAIGQKNGVLKDFYWKLKVVLSSDKMSQINDTLLDLALRIEVKDNKGVKDQLVDLELDRNELNHLIKTLEEAQQTLKQHYS